MLRVLAVLLVLASGCGSSANMRAQDPDRAAWTEARERWVTMRPARYNYRVGLSCECSGVTEYYVSMDGARVDSSAALDYDGNPLVPGTEFEGMEVPAGPHGPSIDELFTLLDDGIRAGNEIRATYDETYGYPTSAQPDMAAAAVDGSIGYSVHDFAAR